MKSSNLPTLVLIGVAVLLATGADAWTPFDRDAEMIRQVGTEAYRHLDRLTPSAHEFKGGGSCDLDYEATFSFAGPHRWCLSEDHLKCLRIPREQAPVEGVIPVSAETRRLLASIWVNVLLESRYPRFQRSGPDGSLHYFSAHIGTADDDLRAQVWSPSKDLPPRWIVDSAEAVEKFCSEGGSGEHDLQHKLAITERRVFQYYRTHGQVYP